MDSKKMSTMIIYLQILALSAILFTSLVNGKPQENPNSEVTITSNAVEETEPPSTTLKVSLPPELPLTVTNPPEPVNPEPSTSNTIPPEPSTTLIVDLQESSPKVTSPPETTISPPNIPSIIPQNAPPPSFESSQDKFHFSYETINGTKREETAELKDLPNEDDSGNEPAIVYKGSYSFISPEGKEYIANYAADENGYRVNIKLVNEK